MTDIKIVTNGAQMRAKNLEYAGSRPTQKAVKYGVGFSFVMVYMLLSVMAKSAVLMPPPMEFKNRHGADLMGGHVNITQQDISIGGPMGLTHSVGTHTSNFANFNDETKARYAPEGYAEPFRGLVEEEIYSECSGCVNKYRMNVTDGTTSTSFDTTADHQTFTPSGDSRHQLLFVSNPTNASQYHQSIIDFNRELGPFTGFIWIKPDGAVVYYPATSRIVYRAIMSHIQRPNGQVIAITTVPVGIGGVADVSTNTGFQLKYVYQYSTKTTSPVAGLPSAQAQFWSLYMPKYLLAINNTKARCPSEHNVYRPGSTPNHDNEGWTKDAVLADACPAWTSGDQWPTVAYAWPDYMPLSMYQGTASFKVTDAEGIVTEYVHTPWTTKNSNGDRYPQAWYDKTPRLTQIKKAGQTVMNYSYLTLDVGFYASTGVAIFYYDPGRPARLDASWIGNDRITYVMGEAYGHGQTPTGVLNRSVDGYQTINLVTNDPQGCIQLNDWDKTALFGSSKVGRLSWVDYKLGGKYLSFEYDTHAVGTAKSHNVTKIIEDGLETTAGGYAVCTPLNYKICNQPTWITDPKNNTTHYEYYPETGLIKKVTLPADENGIRPQTRYYYTAKSAVYLQTPEASTPQLASLPIYLLTRESRCQNTAATTNGCTDPNDEIITEYDYGPSQAGIANNLLLRGVAVTATNSQGLRETRRTCYAYDKYGNRIGETLPRANLSSCP